MRIKWIQRINVRVLATGVLLIAAGLLLRGRPFEWKTVLEGALYVVCLLLLAASEPIRQMLTALPRPQRYFLLILAGLMVVTQLWGQPLKSFPLNPWTMYAKSLHVPPSYIDYIGICADGREVEIPAGRVFRSHHRTVQWRLHGRLASMHYAEEETVRVEQREQFRSLLTAMIKRFNEQHPDTEVQRVRVILCTMPRPAPGLKLDVTRRPVFEYTIQ